MHRFVSSFAEWCRELLAVCPAYLWSLYDNQIVLVARLKHSEGPRLPRTRCDAPKAELQCVRPVGPLPSFESKRCTRERNVVLASSVIVTQLITVLPALLIMRGSTRNVQDANRLF